MDGGSQLLLVVWLSMGMWQEGVWDGLLWVRLCVLILCEGKFKSLGQQFCGVLGKEILWGLLLCMAGFLDVQLIDVVAGIASCGQSFSVVVRVEAEQVGCACLCMPLQRHGVQCSVR
jgi:hypothetical protein